jgi:AraC-like DNA-binding protein/quercetin dioxygenase-like cupin family protein
VNKTELDAYLRKRRVNEEPAFVSDINRNDNMLGMVIDLSTLGIPGETVKIIPHGRFLPVPEHGHSYYEMMYVYSGSITHYINGDRIVLEKGSICLLDTKVKHSTEICGESDVAVNFILNRELFDTAFFVRIKENSLFSDFIANSIYKSDSFGRYLVIHTGDNRHVQDLAASIMSEYYDPDICSEGTIVSLIPVLFNELFRAWRDKGGKKLLLEPDGTSNIWRILRFIETNYMAATLKTTAHRFGYAPNYLSTLLVRITGKSFTEIRHGACLEQASLMLINSDIPIGEIAQKVGFTNVSFFYSLFHRNFGMTPAEFRDKNKRAKSETA